MHNIAKMHEDVKRLRTLVWELMVALREYVEKTYEWFLENMVEGDRFVVADH